MAIGSSIRLFGIKWKRRVHCAPRFYSLISHFPKVPEWTKSLVIISQFFILRFCRLTNNKASILAGGCKQRANSTVTKLVLEVNNCTKLHQWRQKRKNKGQKMNWETLSSNQRIRWNVLNFLPVTPLPPHLLIPTLNPPTSPAPFCPLSFLLPSSPSGALRLLLPLIQTSWGFFHRANYWQLGAQRITFSVQGLRNTQILDWEGECVFEVTQFCVHITH